MKLIEQKFLKVAVLNHPVHSLLAAKVKENEKFK